MLNTTIALIGPHGQLGRELAALLKDASVSVLSREQADLAITGQITAQLQLTKPQLVINCAAYNFVDQAETSPESALAVNALGTRELAQACHAIDVTLVHFSTDYVFGFDATRTKPYVESDAPGPTSTYGVSKLTGEYFVRAYCPRHYVIRTCGLYGKHGVGGKGTNFVETMLKLAAAGKTLRVVSDQILTPTSASDLAQASLQLIQTCPYGLYHLTNAGQCSWFEFAQAIFEIAGITADLHPVSTPEYGSKAARPAYSVLQSENPKTPKLRHWREALEAYLASRT